MDKNLKHILAAAAGIVCLVIYILTLHPSVGFIDSGELAAVVYTFGVPHPTGYPLYLLIGYVFSHLPFGGSVIYKLNLLSAILSSIAVVISFYTSLLLCGKVFESSFFKKTKKQSQSQAADKNKPESRDYNKVIYVVSFFTAVICGLGRTFWFDATQIEVYALHSLFISILVYLSVRILIEIKQKNSKLWIYLFLAFGFSAANHSTTVYFIPGMLYMFYLQYSVSKPFALSLLKYLLLFLPGALLYVILVIVAGNEPYFNWSNPVTLDNLWRHLRGADFSQLMFSSSAKFGDNFTKFFKELPGEMAVLSLLFGIVGFYRLWKDFRRFAVYSAIIIIVCLVYSFNYNTVEINSFYLVVYYLLGLSVSAGIVMAIRYLSKEKGNLSGQMVPKAVMIGLIIAITSIAYNFKENDNSANHVNEDFTIAVLNSLEPNAVLLTYDWAYIYSSSLYYQQVEKLRSDVKVFIVKFLSADWYLGMIRKYYPDVYVFIRPEAEEYIKVVKADEKVRASRLTALVKAFIDKCPAHFPFYVTVDLVLSREMKQFFTANNPQPVGLVYKINEKSIPYDPGAGVKVLNAALRKYEPMGTHKTKMYRLTPGMLFETAFYHSKAENHDLALKFLDKALEFDPNFKEALDLKRKTYGIQK